MGSYYMVIEAGCFGGHHLLGYQKNGILTMEEIHRFDKGVVVNDTEKYWDINRLFDEIKQGLIKCREVGRLPIFVGVDLRAVDFVFLDKENQLLESQVMYHEKSSDNLMKLAAMKEQKSELYEKADCFLLLKDYLNFLLTGVKCCECLAGEASNLLRKDSMDWDYEAIDKLGCPRSAFPSICIPGTILGSLTTEVTEEVGYDCIIVETNSDFLRLLLPDFSEKMPGGFPTNVTSAANMAVLMLNSHELKSIQEARDFLRNFVGPGTP